MIATTSFMQTLAWSLVHFLWQGAAIAAVAASLMFVLRKPATRYLVGVGALALMLASFCITFALVGESSISPAEFSAAGAPAAASPLSLEASAHSMNLTMEEQAAFFPRGDFLWIARGWLAGVFVFALRIAFGLVVLEQLRRRNLVALPDSLVERFRALQERLGIRRVIRYAECQSLRVPAVIGFFRPIVLLPMRALTGLSPEQLEAVIAHELGHIKRFDVAVNFVQVIAETLFFFHPAVWWLNKRIRADREDCCDDVAIAACGGTVGYARALATMEGWRDVPSFAMAVTGSSVAARVARLLGVKRASNTRAAGMVTATLVFATALVAGVASMSLARPALAQTDDQLQQLVAQATEAVEQSDEVELAESAQEAEVAVEVESAVEAEYAQNAEVAQAAEKPVSAPRPVAAPRPAAVPRAPAAPPQAPPVAPIAPVAAPKAPAKTPPVPPVPQVSYIDAMKSVGFDNLEADYLIAMKQQDVSPEYVREIRASGFSPDANELIAMKVHGIDTDYVKQLRAIGFQPDAQQLVAMKVHGITPEYVKGMREAGFNPGTQEIIAMKVHGITPEYVRDIRAAGFQPDSQELVAMKVHGVTPEYHRMLAAAGYKMSTQEIIHARVMDITPEFIRKANDHGFKNLSTEKLIQLKIADVL
jgi:beta-lactamase regulating signal transducer with metallopeptidase domain